MRSDFLQSSAARARRRGGCLDRAARLAGFFRDLGVLLGDDRLGRLVAVEAAERGGRNAAVRALRAVLVDRRRTARIRRRCGCLVCEPCCCSLLRAARAPRCRRVCPNSGRNTMDWAEPRENAGPGRIPDMALNMARGCGRSMPGLVGVGDQHRLVAEGVREHALEVFHLRRVVDRRCRDCSGAAARSPGDRPRPDRTRPSWCRSWSRSAWGRTSPRRAARCRPWRPSPARRSAGKSRCGNAGRCPGPGGSTRSGCARPRRRSAGSCRRRSTFGSNVICTASAWLVRAGADEVVARVLLVAAGIAGHRFGDALGVLVHRLDAPEAAAGDHRGLQALGRGGVHRRRVDLHRGCSECARISGSMATTAEHNRSGAR